MIISKPAIIFIAEKSYHPSINFIPWLLIGSSFVVFHKIFQLNLMLKKQTKILSALRFVCSMIMILLLFILLGKFGFGAIGVVISILVVNILFAVGLYISSQKYNYIYYERLRLFYYFLILFIIMIILVIFSIDNHPYLEFFIEITAFFSLLILVKRSIKFDLFKKIIFNKASILQ